MMRSSNSLQQNVCWWHCCSAVWCKIRWYIFYDQIQKLFQTQREEVAGRIIQLLFLWAACFFVVVEINKLPIHQRWHWYLYPSFRVLYSILIPLTHGHILQGISLRLTEDRQILLQSSSATEWPQIWPLRSSEAKVRKVFFSECERMAETVPIEFEQSE